MTVLTKIYYNKEVDYVVGLSYHEDTEETKNTESMDYEQPGASKDHEARAERRSMLLGARPSSPPATLKRPARIVENDPHGYQRFLEDAMTTMNKNIASQFANWEHKLDLKSSSRQFTGEEKGTGRATDLLEGDFGPSKKRQTALERPSLADASPSLSRPSAERHRQVNGEPSIGTDLNTTGTYLWITAPESY